METFAATQFPYLPASSGPAQLLVVDDEIEHAEICAALLRRRGYTVAVASSGSEAVALARALKPDLILLDLYMPMVDGFSTAEDLHGHADTREVPIVILSACGEALESPRAAELGVVATLAKPFHARDLIECVERALPGAPHR
jgi:two-component system alkaline phosphatase synthesis response regulator PhoP